MKKFLFIASALAIVAGCAKVTTVNTEEPQEIAFMAYSNAATKTPIEDKILPDGYKMLVHAMHMDGEDGSAKYQEYFDGIIFKKGTDGYWSGSQYWPPQGKLQFNALAPDDAVTSAGATFKVESNAVTTVSATMLDNTDTQFDLLVARPSTYTERVSAVSLTFDHALAQISVAVGATAAGLVTVNSINLNSVYQAGDVKATVSPLGQDGKVQFTWTPTEDSKKSVVISTNPVELTTTLYKYTSKLVVPISLTAENTITINYDYGKAKDLSISLPLTSEQISSWNAGMKYIYNISFSANEIKINPTVAEWDEEASGITVGN